MAETYSVKAVLSAYDKGFSAAMKNATKSTDALGSKIKSGLSFGILTGVGQQAFTTLTNGARELIGEISASNAAWKTFTGNMQMLGKGKKEIAGVKKELQAFAEQTIYSSSDMATTYAQLAAVGTKNCTKLVKGFGGLAAAAENPQQAMKTLSMQATQMAAKPTVAWQDFKLMLEQTPAGIAAVAKEMGMSTSELVKAVQDGTVKTDEFFDAITKVGTNDAFTKLATEYKTAGQALDGLKETLGNKLTPAFDVLSKKAIGSISKIIDKLGKIDAEKLAKKLEAGLKKAQPYWDMFKATLSVVGKVLGVVAKALQTVGGFLLDHANIFSKLIPVILGGVGAFKAYAFLKGFNPFGIFAKKAKKPLENIPNQARKSLSMVRQVFGGLSKVIKSVGTAASVAARGIGSGLATAFRGLGLALRLANPVAILAIGAAISMVAATFSIFSNAGKPIATVITAIGTGFGKLAPLVTAIGNAFSTVLNAAITAVAKALRILAPILPIIASSFAQLSPLVTALGTAISKVATAIGTAVSRIIKAITPLVKVVTDAFTNIVEIISNSIVRIVQALAPYAPELTKMIEATSKAVQSVAKAFSTLVENISPIIDSLSNMLESVGEVITRVFEGIAKVLESVGGVISKVLDSIANVIESVGNSALNAGKGFKYLASGVKTIVDTKLSDLAASLSAVALGIGKITSKGKGITDIGNSMQTLSLGMTMLSVNAMNAITGMNAIASAAFAMLIPMQQLVLILSTASTTVLQFTNNAMIGFSSLGTASNYILMLISSISVLTTAIIGSIASIRMFSSSTAILSSSALIAGTGITFLTGATKTAKNAITTLSASAKRAGAAFLSLANSVKRAMGSVVSSTTKAKTSMRSIQTSTKMVGSEFISLASKAKSAMSRVIAAMNSAASKAKSTGLKLGKGFTSGMKSGLNSAVFAARSAINRVISALRSGRGRAYSAGAYISKGFASGMRSQLGVIRSAAAQMAAAADKAVRAKAKIHSPSRVSMKLGEYWGKGFGGGVLDMVGFVKKASQKLIDIPTINTPTLSFTYAGEMSSDYEYYRNANYTIVVPVEIDGREVAKATAPYTEEELNKRQNRANRKKGKI